MPLSFIKSFLIDPEFNRKRKFLQRISLFQGISRREFGHLFQALVTRPYAPGEILFHEGDVGRALFILESGHVEISVRAGDGGMRRIAVLNPGDYFGEMALLDDRPRTATAAAMEPVKVHLLYKADLEKLVRNVPHIGAAIMTHLAILLAARLRAMTDTAPISIASTVPTVPVKEVIG
jgi:CRP/FNR family transcriptional regulator, cyclic AMP receptor protein